MAYDDSRFRGESNYRDDLESGYSSRYPPTPAQLSNVFDDPSDGEPGRDKLGVHLLWELVILLFAAAVLVVLRDRDASAFAGAELRQTLVLAAVVGLLAVGAGLSLRAAVPNLAVGTIAVACAVFFARNSDRPGVTLTSAALITLLVAIGVGAVLAVLVVGFHVPSWAATLGVAFAIAVWLDKQRAASVDAVVYQPSKHGLYWLVGVTAVAVLGGLLGTVRSVRRTLGRFRPVADPGQRRGAAGGAVAGLALLGSCLLAAAGGILLALEERPVPTGDAGLPLAALALGAALLGGTSAFGRRGGIAGTPLAVVLLVGLLKLGEAEHWGLDPLAVGAAAILAGLIVTRLIESFGRPADPAFGEDDEVDAKDWTAARADPLGTGSPALDDLSGGPSPSLSTTDTWSTGPQTDGWTSQLPTRTAEEPSWSTDDRWGGR